MGYSNVNAQLLTVPVYILAAVVFLIVGRLSDHYQLRSPFLAGAFVCIIVGYGIQIGVDHVGGRYAGLFITAMGMYVVPGLNVSWISNNTAGHYKRTTAFGLNQLVGNCAGAA
jgi:MFS family permease